MYILDLLVKLEKLDLEYKKLVDKINAALHEQSSLGWEYLPKEEKEKYAKLNDKLAVISCINNYKNMSCWQSRGIRTYYLKKDRIENLRPNGKESMQIRLWNGMNEYDDSEKMHDVVFLKNRRD